MRHRTLGTTGFDISAVGFGAWAIGGGGWVEGWGPQDDRESIEAIHRAIDLGVNWIDTAGAYGLGHSEIVIARALRGMRDRPYVFTKRTSTWDSAGNINSVLKADSIRREVEGSLSRLEVEQIDLCQLHMPEPQRDIEEGWATLLALRDEGKVAQVGVSNFDVAQLRRCETLAPVPSLQVIYSILNSDIENELLPVCADHSIGVIVYSPMASGLLTGTMTRQRIAGLPSDDRRSRWPDFQEPRVSRSLAVVEGLRPIADRIGRRLGELAIAWTLRDHVVAGATVGFRSKAQVEDLIGAGDVTLGAADLEQIESLRPKEPLLAMSMEGSVSALDMRPQPASETPA